MATEIETAFLEEKDDAAWDALVASSPHGTVFHSTRWLRLVAPAFGRVPRIVGVFRNGTLVGGAPVYERRLFGLLIADPPVLAGYAGAIADFPEVKRTPRAISETEQVLEALEGALRRRYAFARLVHPPGLIDARSFQWGGWRVQPRFTYGIEIEDPEISLERFDHNARKKVRKAITLGYTVERSPVRGELLTTYAGAYDRHQTPVPVPLTVIASLASALPHAGIARSYVVRDRDGNERAFQILPTDARVGYTLFSGSDPAVLRDGIFSLLQLRIIEDLAGAVARLDLMGANTPPIAAFKRAFGGNLVPYWESTYATRRAGWILGTASALRSRFRMKGSTSRT